MDDMSQIHLNNTGASVVGVIPARGGSVSVFRKNVALLCGKPLISYVLKSALQSKLLTTVAVSSDDEDILCAAEIHSRSGSRTVALIRRPDELATESSPSLPVIQHAVRELEQEEKRHYDYVVMLQPTSPLMTSEDVDGCLHKLIKSEADAVMSVVQSNSMHPYKAKRITSEDRLVPYIDGLEETEFTRQHFEPVFKRNGAIYASRRDVVLERGELYGQGPDTRPYVMPRERSLDINDMVDFMAVESMIKYQESGACGTLRC